MKFWCFFIFLETYDQISKYFCFTVLCLSYYIYYTDQRRYCLESSVPICHSFISASNDNASSNERTTLYIVYNIYDTNSLSSLILPCFMVLTWIQVSRWNWLNWYGQCHWMSGQFLNERRCFLNILKYIFGCWSLLTFPKNNNLKMFLFLYYHLKQCWSFFETNNRMRLICLQYICYINSLSNIILVCFMPSPRIQLSWITLKLV